MITNEIKRRMTITEVAQIVGISAKTIMRWEKMGKIKKTSSKLEKLEGL